MVVLSLLACAKQVPAEPTKPTEPTQERAHARKAGAPVALQATVGAQSTSIQASFTGQGTDVQLLAWGASGLDVPGEKLRWSGATQPGQQVELELEHTGGGDLAVRIVGVFAGERVDEVRSWTVGRREKTPVPVNGGSKGWDATRR